MAISSIVNPTPWIVWPEIVLLGFHSRVIKIHVHKILAPGYSFIVASCIGLPGQADYKCSPAGEQVETEAHPHTHSWKARGSHSPTAWDRKPILLCVRREDSHKRLYRQGSFTGHSGWKLGEQKASFQQQGTGGLNARGSRGSGWAAGVLMEGDGFVCKISDNSVIFH